MKLKQKHLAELLISFGEYYQFDWKISPAKKHKHIKCIYSLIFLTLVIGKDPVKDDKKQKIKLNIK